METTLWAKLPDGLTESAELIVTGPDDFRTEEDLRADNYLPLVYTAPPDVPAGRGYYWNARYRRIEDERIEQFWVEEEAPVVPRTISKFKLKLAIAQAGLLSDFTTLLSQVEVAPGYMGDEAFRDAVTLDDDNPKFKAAVQLVKQQFGMTDEEVERILAASVAD